MRHATHYKRKLKVVKRVKRSHVLMVQGGRGWHSARRRPFFVEKERERENFNVYSIGR